MKIKINGSDVDVEEIAIHSARPGRRFDAGGKDRGQPYIVITLASGQSFTVEDTMGNLEKLILQIGKMNDEARRRPLD